MENFNKKGKPVLKALYLVIALEITFLIAALISFFIKADILTGSSTWSATQAWGPIDVFCICTLIFAAVEAGLMVNGKRPLFFSKAAWTRSGNKWQNWGLAFIWAYALQIAAVTICNFSYAMGKWSVIIPAIVTAVLEVCVVTLIRFGKRKMGIRSKLRFARY